MKTSIQNLFSKIQTSCKVLSVFSFLLIVNLAVAQREAVTLNCFSYTCAKTVKYGIPSSANLDSISSFDIAGIRPYQEISHVTNTLFDIGKIKQEIFYPNGYNYPDSWATKIYRTESFDNFIQLYDVRDSLVYSERIGATLDSIELTPSIITSFGYEQPILTPTTNEILTMTNNGFSFYQSGDVYAFLSDSIRYFSNPLENTRETIFLDTLRNIYLSVFEKFDTTNIPGKYITRYRTTKSYLPSYLSNFNILKYEKEVYSDYLFPCSPESQNSKFSNSLSDDLYKKPELTIFRYSEDETLLKPTECSVYPNPSSQIINILMPENLHDMVLVEILQLNGSCLLKDSFIPDNIAQIDVSGIPNGSYLIKITTTDLTIIKQILIQR